MVQQGHSPGSLLADKVFLAPVHEKGVNTDGHNSEENHGNDSEFRCLGVRQNDLALATCETLDMKGMVVFLWKLGCTSSAAGIDSCENEARWVDFLDAKGKGELLHVSTVLSMADPLPIKVFIGCSCFVVLARNASTFVVGLGCDEAADLIGVGCQPINDELLGLRQFKRFLDHWKIILLLGGGSTINCRFW